MKVSFSLWKSYGDPMDAQTQLEQTLLSRLSSTNRWIIRINGLLLEAADHGWPKIHSPELFEEPEEVQERVMEYFRAMGYQAYRGQYSGYGLDTVWFSSEPKKEKEPGVISQVIHRLFGGSKDRH